MWTKIQYSPVFIKYNKIHSSNSIFIVIVIVKIVDNFMAELKITLLVKETGTYREGGVG